MRFLLDTNILIPLEDPNQTLEESLANFVRLAQGHNHVLMYHPATEEDFRRDGNVERRARNLERIRRYIRLEDCPPCPWNRSETSPNDAADNNILYALQCDAVHALVTEDRRIHEKARSRGLANRVYTIQTAEDWLRRLHEQVFVQLPEIEDLPLYSLIPLINTEFFDSLKRGYPEFNNWIREKAREGRRAWVSRERDGLLGAICIYARQDEQTITEEGLKLHGRALKLSTFKVGLSVRGKKIGELFLKAAFRFATANNLENIFIHGDPDEHHYLFNMLEEFGFSCVGTHPGSSGRDAVYLKHHPTNPPSGDLPPFEYNRRFFPHFRSDSSIGKFIVPIQPTYHRILFPDYETQANSQMSLFSYVNSVGNAIRMAYLCHSQTKLINSGDIVLFYRSSDLQAITSIGIVENYGTMTDESEIAAKVRRRTVYSMEEIRELSTRPTRVMLFRLISHLANSLTIEWLKENKVLNGVPQSILRISNGAFERIMRAEQ